MTVNIVYNIFMMIMYMVTFNSSIYITVSMMIFSVTNKSFRESIEAQNSAQSAMYVSRVCKMRKVKSSVLSFCSVP